MEAAIETSAERSIESPGAAAERSRAASLSVEANGLHAPVAGSGATRSEADQINAGLSDTASLYNQNGTRSAAASSASGDRGNVPGGAASSAISDSSIATTSDAGIGPTADTRTLSDSAPASVSVTDSASYGPGAGGASASADSTRISSDVPADQALRYVPSLEITDRGAPVAASGVSDHGQHAAQILEKVGKIEKQVTSDIVGVGGATGGEPAGLKHNLKTHESLTRKLETDARDNRPREINDALRYTLTYPPQRLADGANQSMQKLEQMGYEKLAVTNSFNKKDTPYKGINTTFARDGQKFEVQFHTPESYQVKEATHGLYDIRRDLPAYNDGRPETGDRAAAKAKEYIGHVKEHPHIDSQVSKLASSHGLEAGRISEKLVRMIERRSVKMSAKIEQPSKIDAVQNFPPRATGAGRSSGSASSGGQ